LIRKKKDCASRGPRNLLCARRPFFRPKCMYFSRPSPQRWTFG
jgi:hypothetical protein